MATSHDVQLYSMLSHSLLREYTDRMDPPITAGGTVQVEDDAESTQSLSSASTKVNSSPQDLAVPSPATSLLERRITSSVPSKCKCIPLSDSTHGQNATQAMDSRPLCMKHNPPRSMSSQLIQRLSAVKELHVDGQKNDHHSHHLSAPRLNLTPSTQSPFISRFSALESPCYFHQRFDDVINVDRVLQEISESGMSHSRLMQTATSVREISKQLQRRPIKRAVRTIMIVTKARDNSLVYLTRDLTEWLLKTPRYDSDLGVTVYVDAKLGSSSRFNAGSLLASNPNFKQMLKYWTPSLCMTHPELFDLVITLGGDGTVLYTSSLFQGIVPAVLSFSLGSLGFLTNFEFASYQARLNRIMGEQGMRVNFRMRFTCTVYRACHPNKPAISQKGRRNQNAATAIDIAHSSHHTEEEQFEVLNELVIDRGPSPYVSNLELFADNELLTVIQADGCIISTPTGSTAYSLSAGGPLTQPSIPAILLTPICPHTLSFRPMVLSDTLLLKICVPKSSRSTAYANFDGKGRVELRRGDYVQVEVGRYPFPTVVGDGGTEEEWFDSVRRRLGWNNRGAVQHGFGAGGEERHTSLANREVIKKHDETEDEYDEDAEEEWDIDIDPIDVNLDDNGIAQITNTNDRLNSRGTKTLAQI